MTLAMNARQRKILDRFKMGCSLDEIAEELQMARVMVVRALDKWRKHYGVSCNEQLMAKLYAPTLDVTDRERRMIEMVARGMPYRDMVGYLALSESSIEVYMQRLRRRLGARDNLHLLAMWFQSMSQS